MLNKEAFDVVIIGGGPAGMVAGQYAGRAKLKTLFIEKLSTGGQMASTGEVENYPGFMKDITGPELATKFEDHAKQFGAERLGAEVKEIALEGKLRIVKTNKGDFVTKAVIVATGANPRMVGVPGEAELRGRGVSYCAVCDAAFYEGSPNVVVIGGGDSAVEEALYLTKFADKVTILHRRDALRATKVIQERAFANPKIEIMWNTVPVSIHGDGIVESIKIKNVKTEQVQDLATEGVFVYVGQQPNTEFLKGLIDLDEVGFVKAGEDMKTNVSGIFVAGDNRVKILRQIITAAADGAIAAFQAEKYIEANFHE